MVVKLLVLVIAEFFSVGGCGGAQESSVSVCLLCRQQGAMVGQARSRSPTAP